MLETLKPYFSLPTPEEFTGYVIPQYGVTPIDVSKLDLELLEGEERENLRVPTKGDASMLLRYKRREGAVSGAEVREADLNVLQLQGARQEGFRVNSGMRWVNLFADRWLQIAEHPNNELYRVTMRPLVQIEGFTGMSESARRPYEQFTSRLGMRFSREQDIFVRDVQKRR